MLQRAKSALTAVAHNATMDASYIYLQEDKQLPLANDLGAAKPSPAAVMFWALSGILANPAVDYLYLDGTQKHWNMVYGIGENATVVDAQSILDYDKPVLPWPDAVLQPIVKAFYLARYYINADVRQFVITRHPTGYIVHVNDPSNPRVWASHRVS